MFDVALLGGGLANGLLAYRLATTRKDLSVVMLERGDSLGGNHTWCFHQTDVSPDVFEWLRPLLSHAWPHHTVAFPGRVRKMEGGYCCLTSHDFHRRLAETLGDRIRLSCQGDIDNHTPGQIRLDQGRTLSAKVIVDGRGFQSSPGLEIGFQKFFGLEVELQSPHHMTGPMIMDARVEQEDGFRFVYVLPFGPNRLLMEDTCYSDTVDLDRPLFRRRLERYAKEKGFMIAGVLREESGALPIVLGGARPSTQPNCVGLKAGFFNGATGYSLAIAATVASRLAQLPNFDQRSVADSLESFSKQHWKHQGFFRMLNRMLFRSGSPHLRMQVIDAFYHNSDALIARFYAGNLTLADKLSILIKGAPTVPTAAAVHAAFNLR